MHGNQRTNPVGGSSAAKLGNNVGSAVNKGENVSEPEAWEQSHGENVGERTHERTSLQVGEDRLRSGARPAQGTATTTDDGLVRGRHKARPLQWIFVDCSLVADARTSGPTVRGWIIACVTYYSLVLACWPAQGAATTMDGWCGAAG